MTVDAVVFDAYGTLFDVHSVAARCEALFPGRGAALSQLWRAKQLEYTWLRSLMNRYEPFDHVTGDALRHACTAMSLNYGPDIVDELLQEYRRLSPYAEIDEALRQLSGRKLAILSNGTPQMLEAVVENAGLRARFAAVLSVDPLDVYKPHPSVYRYGAEQLGVAPEHVAFVSSNFWDIAGATSFGFRAYWINRNRNAPDELAFRPVRQLASLNELPAALPA